MRSLPTGARRSPDQDRDRRKPGATMLAPVGSLGVVDCGGTYRGTTDADGLHHLQQRSVHPAAGIAGENFT
jgi:hypothetical protein